jgi:hypothetical protein
MFCNQFSRRVIFIRFHNTLAIPEHLHGCEIWTLKQRDIRRLKTAEMRFVRRTARYSLFYYRKKRFLEELNVEPVEEKLG